jgi:hypothetical protein
MLHEEPFSARLRERMHKHFDLIKRSETYRVVTDPKTPTELVFAIIKHILLEVFSYGPHVTEATFTAVGRFPKHRPDLMRPAIEHDLEEVNHGEVALVDFVKLGGSEAWARTRKMTPATFSLAGTVRLLATTDSPFAYLGFMYLFESLTPALTSLAQEVLAARQYPKVAQTFIDMHATEDIAHERQLAELIDKVVTAFPLEAENILYGFDCFAVVYPLPIWQSALIRANEEVTELSLIRSLEDGTC